MIGHIEKGVNICWTGVLLRKPFLVSYQSLIFLSDFFKEMTNRKVEVLWVCTPYSENDVGCRKLCFGSTRSPKKTGFLKTKIAKIRIEIWIVEMWSIKWYRSYDKDKNTTDLKFETLRKTKIKIQLKIQENEKDEISWRN